MNIEQQTAFDTLTLKGIALLIALKDTLRLELIALTARELAEIIELSKRKNNILIEFSENTFQRSTLLQSLNLASNKENIGVFFSRCQNLAAKNKYLANWATLEDTLRLTIDANAINEQVLKKSQKNIDTILSILQGKQANNILYDAKGDKGDYAGQSRIGKA